MTDSSRGYQQFFAEMKRRKVFRVMAVYGATAFVLLQVAELLADGMGLSDQVLRVTTFLVLIGFPIAVVLAWAFESTPDGVKRTTDASPAEISEILAQPASKRWLSGLLALSGVVLLFGGGWWMGQRSGSGPEPNLSLPEIPALEVAAKSVAVLPFVDLSPEGDQQWFADGLSDAILNSLAALPELKVTARTSSFQFRGQERNITEIADTLGVAHIVEGSVQVLGDDLKIVAQLIRASDGTHLWSQSYQRPTEDLFDVQEEVAEHVAATLDVFLDEGKREAMFSMGTRDVEAFKAYLRGLEVSDQWHAKVSPIPFDSANVHFELAMQLDPGYAEAAISHMDPFSHILLEGLQATYTPEEALSRVQQDLQFAATHASTEVTRLMAEINRVYLSSNWRRFPVLFEQLDKAVSPGRTLPRTTGWTDLVMRLVDRELGRRLLTSELEVSPLDPVVWYKLANIELLEGNTDTALALIDRGRRTAGDHRWLDAGERHALANAGRETELAAVLQRYQGQRVSVLAWRDVVIGDSAAARERMAKYDEETDRPEVEFLFVYRELGDREAAAALAARVDDLLLGPAILFLVVGLSGSVPFDLADTPNFRAQLDEAGIDLSDLGAGPKGP